MRGRSLVPGQAPNSDFRGIVMSTKQLRFDIRLRSEANLREHWSAKGRRKKAQQHEFAILWRNMKTEVQLPATIVLTRHSERLMDPDNNAGSFKHVQDALAALLKVDDGDVEQVRWVYEQAKVKRGEFYFTIEIRPWEEKQ